MKTKIVGRIDHKTGKMTLKVEGMQGEGCMNIPALKKLVTGLGMTDEVEKTSEFYEQPAQEQVQQGL